MVAIIVRTKLWLLYTGTIFFLENWLEGILRNFAALNLLKWSERKHTLDSVLAISMRTPPTRPH